MVTKSRHQRVLLQLSPVVLKLVDRLEFVINFSADKTWDKGESTLKNVNSNIGNSGNGDTKSLPSHLVGSIHPLWVTKSFSECCEKDCIGG